jgi:hypothetical protein
MKIWMIITVIMLDLSSIIAILSNIITLQIIGIIILLCFVIGVKTIQSYKKYKIYQEILKK